MNLIENILTQLSEEAAEVAVECSKANRFGLDDRYSGKTVRERLVGELNDLMALAQLCVENGIIPDDWQDREAQEAKLLKVYQFTVYSLERGTLSTGHFAKGINKTTRPVKSAPLSGGAALSRHRP